MLIQDLEERLRATVQQRVRAGLLSGLELARRAGFQQAHISNFLNHRRGLSVDGFDRLLRALDLTVLDLLPEGSSRNDLPLRDYDDVPVVRPESANFPSIAANAVTDVLKFKRAYLRRIRADAPATRQRWTRFILVKTDVDTANAMAPRVTPGASLLVDRHYVSLTPYRKRDPNMYVVSRAQRLYVRYLQRHGNNMLLRPASADAPLISFAIESGRKFEDYIVGRVCYVGMEI